MNTRYSRYYTFIKPFLQNKAVKTYSSLVFSLITITFFGIFAVRPTLYAIVSLQRTLDEQHQILDSLNKKVDNLSVGKKNYQNLDPKLKQKLANLLPQNPALPIFASSLTGLAQQYQASISGLQFQPIDIEQTSQIASKNATTVPVDFSLSLQGDYSQLANFLTALGHFDRLVTIQSVTFNKQLDSPLIMLITARTYFLKS